jgi:hypothetical protein
MPEMRIEPRLLFIPAHSLIVIPRLNTKPLLLPVDFSERNFQVSTNEASEFLQIVLINLFRAI